MNNFQRAQRAYENQGPPEDDNWQECRECKEIVNMDNQENDTEDYCDDCYNKLIMKLKEELTEQTQKVASIAEKFEDALNDLMSYYDDNIRSLPDECIPKEVEELVAFIESHPSLHVTWNTWAEKIKKTNW